MDLLLGLPTMPVGDARLGAGLALVVIGVGFIARATRDLARVGGGTPSPLVPPIVLVTSGAYRLCRHPMFLGYDLAAAGTILIVGSWGSLVLTYPLFLALQLRYLRREEGTLARKFGERYTAYRERTPFLLPRPPGAR